MADMRTTGFLDDFQRPNEDPLSFGGRWELLVYDGVHNLKLDGFRVELFETSGGSSQASAWTYESFAGDVEVWGLAAPEADLREGLRLYLHMTQPYGKTGVNEYSGYRAEFGVPIIGSAFVDIVRFDNGDPTGLAEVNGDWGHLVDEESIPLLRTVGDQVELWHSADSGQTWTLQLSATDPTYRFGYLGLGTAQDDDNPGWLGFGGGLIRRTQMYRWFRETKQVF
jgi:hypothetical protein